MTNHKEVNSSNLVGDTWVEWSKHVLTELEKQSNRGEQNSKELSEINISFGKLETKLMSMLENFSECRLHCVNSTNIFEKKMNLMEESAATMCERVNNIESGLDELKDTLMGTKDNYGLKSKTLVLVDKVDSLRNMVYSIFGFISALCLGTLIYLINTKILSLI